MPPFRRDGRAIAFCRLPGGFVSEIYVQSSGRELSAHRKVRRLTNDKTMVRAAGLERDGRSILYVFGDDSSKAREIRTIDDCGPAKACPNN